MDTDRLKINSATIDHLLTRLYIQNQNKHTSKCICKLFHSHADVNDTTLVCPRITSILLTDIFPLSLHSQNVQAQQSETGESIGTVCVLCSDMYWTDCSSMHTRRMRLHCGASVSELYRVFIGSMVVTYSLHVCNVSAQCTIGYLYKFMHRQSG